MSACKRRLKKCVGGLFKDLLGMVLNQNDILWLKNNHKLIEAFGLSLIFLASGWFVYEKAKWDAAKSNFYSFIYTSGPIIYDSKMVRKDLGLEAARIRGVLKIGKVREVLRIEKEGSLTDFALDISPEEWKSPDVRRKWIEHAKENRYWLDNHLESLNSINKELKLGFEKDIEKLKETCDKTKYELDKMEMDYRNISLEDKTRLDDKFGSISEKTGVVIDNEKKAIEKASKEATQKQLWMFYFGAFFVVVSKICEWIVQRTKDPANSVDSTI